MVRAVGEPAQRHRPLPYVLLPCCCACGALQDELPANLANTSGTIAWWQGRQAEMQQRLKERRAALGRVRGSEGADGGARGGSACQNMHSQASLPLPCLELHSWSAPAGEAVARGIVIASPPPPHSLPSHLPFLAKCASQVGQTISEMTGSSYKPAKPSAPKPSANGNGKPSGVGKAKAAAGGSGSGAGGSGSGDSSSSGSGNGKASAPRLKLPGMFADLVKAK